MISVAICTVDRHQLLADLIRQLAPQIAQSGGYKVIVVDSSRERGQEKQSDKLLPRQITYLNGSSSGLSAARNIAIAACNTPYIAFIDDDALPCDNWVNNILKAFEFSGEHCAAVGGKIKPAWLSPRPQWLPDQLLPYLSILDMGNRKKELFESEYLYGTNIAFRLSSLKKTGGFRTDLGRTRTKLLSNEETELQQRLVNQGKKVIYSPDIAVQHKIFAERLTQQWFFKRIFWQAISDKIAENKNREFSIEILKKYDNTRICPHHLTEEKLMATEDPEQFFQQCVSLYDRACHEIDLAR